MSYLSLAWATQKGEDCPGLYSENLFQENKAQKQHKKLPKNKETFIRLILPKEIYANTLGSYSSTS